MGLAAQNIFLGKNKMSLFKNDQKLIWNFFQSEEKFAFKGAIPRYKFLAKEVTKNLDYKNKILNIGIGPGILENNLKKLGYEIYALDPSKNVVNELNKFGIKSKVGQIESIPFPDNKFDCVIASEIIEHIPVENLQISIREISRVLKSNGILLTTVPFNELLRDNKALCPKCGNDFHRWGHHSSFNVENFSKLFKEKYKIKKIKTLSFPEFSFSLFGIAKYLLKFILGRIGHPISSPRIFLHAKKL